MKNISICVFIFLCTSSVYGQGGPKVDVTDFDVGGVKLGMSVSETISALSDTYKVNEDDITLSTSTFPHPVIGEDLISSAELLSDGAEKSVLGMRSGWRIRVYFVAKVPYEEDEVVAFYITYETPFSQKNSDSIKTSALQKYGPATVNNPMGGISWCSETEGWRGCKSEAKLEIINTNLELRDESLSRFDLEAQVEAKAVPAKF